MFIRNTVSAAKTSARSFRGMFFVKKSFKNLPNFFIYFSSQFASAVKSDQ